MEDFEYSVEICDRDWECFFEECEECNLLSPAIAGVESGMSDFDDTSSIFANIIPKSHPTTDFPEEDCTNDGQPECDGSPVDSHLKKHGLGGMESILSGSEEDIHLQCVNVFLERLRSDAEAEEFTEPRSQGWQWTEKHRAATQEEGCCAGGKPEASLRFNSASIKSETKVGQAIEPHVNNHNGKKKKNQFCSNVASTVPDLNPLLQDNQSACFKGGKFITEEVATETKSNETTRSTQPCCSWNDVDAESQMAETLKKVKMAPDVAKQESERSSLERNVGTSCSKQDVVTHERANDDLSVAQPAAAKSNKLASHDLSPSAAVKRKRRRKRRLGEVVDSMQGCEKQDFVKSSDSEEDQGAFFTHELQKCAQCSPTENCSGKASVKDKRTNDPSYQILQRGMCKMTCEFENDITNGRTHASDNSGISTTRSENPCRLQFQQSGHLYKCPALQKVKSLCICSDSKQPCNAEVKSGRCTILPDWTEEIEQNESLLATETPVGEGNVISDRLSNILHQQQLETTCSLKDQDGDSMENNDFSVSEVSANGSDTGNTNSEQSPTCSQLVECATLAVDTQESQPSECPNNNISGQPEEHPEMLSTWPKYKVMSQSDTTAELRCPSDLTAVSSCCTADTRSLTSLSNGSITEMSDCSCAPVSQPGLRALRDETSLKTHEEVDGHQSWSASNDAADLRCDVAINAGESVALIEAESQLVPDSKNSVFVMSSFWREMEKLTINDILGLRMISGAASDCRLPPLQENDPVDGLDWSDSGFFTQPDEPKAEGTHEENPSQNVCADDILLTPAIDSPHPPAAVESGLRKMSKNVSVHNLPALEVGNHTWKREALKTQIEEEFENLDEFIGEGISKEGEEGDCPDSSAQHSFSMTLGGIFDFIFGRRQPHSSPSATDDLSSYSYGSSVPETYDHFFSEFDTESFFYPFIRANDQVKDQPVPVFSYSTPARGNIQYPEVYECFFTSSSSDESSTESDEEENHSPIRVVTRFSRTSSSSKFPTDIYDCFFTDKDLKKNLFWKNVFSFRNMSLNASGLKQQSISNSLVTVKPGVRPFKRTFLPLSSLGSQNAVFFDPALHPFGDRFFGQLPQQPLDFENLQMNTNPRLDAPLLPLRQSDMCLICIAFASWVLKTANPQVGDAWKAVLLANVSALSAIRYLRKYVKLDEDASDEKHLT